MSKGEERNTKKDGVTTKKGGSIRKKLLISVLPVVVISICVVMIIGVVNLHSQLDKALNRSLHEEAETNVNAISGWTKEVLASLNTVRGAMESINFGSDEAEIAYLETTLTLNDACPNGIYAGDASGVYLDGSGWVPDASYVISERDWYKEGLTHDTFQFGAPYIDESTGDMVVSASVLLNRPDRNQMVASTDVVLSKVTDIVSHITVMGTKSGYGFLVDATTNTVIAHKNPEWNGQAISPEHEDPLMAWVSERLADADGTVHTVSDKGLDNCVTMTPVDGTTWVLVTSVSRSEVMSELYMLIIKFAVTAILCIIVVAIVVSRVIGTVIKPINRLTEDLTKIASGDFTVDIESKSDDEVGQMSTALQKYIAIMRRVIDGINQISATLDVKASSGRTSAENLSTTAEDQHFSMQSMQQAVDELARSVSELADNATSLAMIVDTTNQEGIDANERMGQTVSITMDGREDMLAVQKVMQGIVQNMEELSDVVEEVGRSTEEINEIIKMIENIASQTNLLSLNASIEAARAGEVGRGFAVVASEIGQLADDSANSTHQISDIINSISSQVQSMVLKTRESVVAIEENAGVIDKACDTFNRITQDIDMTSGAITSIMEKIKNVDEVATNMAAISEEQSATAEEVLATIEMLTQNSSRITTESKEMEDNSDVVAESAETLVEHMKYFRV